MENNNNTERLRLKQIQINKMIVEEVKALDEEMKKKFSKDEEFYRLALNYCLEQQHKGVFKYNASMDNGEVIERRMVAEVRNKWRIEALKKMLKDSAKKRKEYFKFEVEMIRCKLDSAYCRDYNIKKAKQHQEMSDKMRESGSVTVERNMETRNVKTSGLKRRSDENRIAQNYKLKCQPDFAKLKMN